MFFLQSIAQQKKPNIVWLMAEDMSLDLECYGMPDVKTPNLNKMATQGVRFDNCFVTNPICSPSRSAMMLGVHQLLTNAQHHRSNRNIPLKKPYKPFTYWLRKVGYTTILGNHQVFTKGRKIDVNFKHKPLGAWDGDKEFGLFDKYDRFEKSDEPFFAQIQLKVTHRGDWWNAIRKKSKHPHDPNKIKLPSYFADHPKIRLDWAKYLDQIEYMDKEVGLIFDELKQKDLLKNTIVIFIGDNGRCNIRGKGYLYDEGLHIPLIVYYPNELKPGQVRKDVVSATDITATILDFAKVNIPDYFTGKSIFKKDFQREFVFGTRDLWDEIDDKSRAITSDKWKYIRNDKTEIPYDAHQAYLEFYRPAVHVMRKLHLEKKLNRDQNLFFQPQKPSEELYDLKKDPEELHNLADDPKYAVKLDELRKELIGMEENHFNTGSYEPVIPNAEKLYNWVKQTKPELYQKMLDGDEIGFQHLSSEYKKYLQVNKK